jgi:hypothetical protein
MPDSRAYITAYDGIPRLFIEATQPEGRSTTSLSSQESWDLSSNTYDNASRGDVCVQVLQEPLLRPGDDWYWFQNWEMRVDGWLVSRRSRGRYIVSHNVEDTAVYLYEGGDIVAKGAITDTVCVHKVATKPGLHVVDFKVWTSTGEEATYSWAFKIVP